ncbi:NAD+ synthase [Mucisphaera calidilacus]|uniref:Glutamine-dependent NAD(+) synthetase n=1 Tax=Mucisphaera calidilacus TaxID=2527982 RepID=A0A518BZQ9_9BACT|nr:NAD+ synthase [Mucisphaera calidilacus]QDU72458.1 Glutamine-dependent NAD(+) synthetase [Mucisphaera calidilacus]
MRVALAQINPTVGDIAGNHALIAGAIDEARRSSADLLVLPELAVCGYPPKDLLLKPDLIDGCAEAVADLASRCQGLTAVIGYPTPSPAPMGAPLYNAAAVCADGAVQATVIKTLLPTYDVFDERRYFEPGERPITVPCGDHRLGITICEDLWNEEALFERRLYVEEPAAHLAGLGASLLINTAASPFTRDKQDFRLKLMAHVAKRHGLPLVYVNQVGGNDELVFDGGSCVVNGRGEVIAHAAGFAEDFLVVDLDAPAAAAEPAYPRGIAGVYHALVLGLRDYCRKCGFTSVVLGLSGGIDSALSAAICVDALGPERVTGVTMPSRYSSSGSVDDAEELAVRMGITFHRIPIEGPHGAFEGALSEVFAGLEPDVTEENVQARIRGTLLMAISNKTGSMLVTTGNKSELAVGYCTLYGDMAGGLAVLSDLPKTQVYEMARWINSGPDSPLLERFGGPVIPEATISKPPSAELRPDQVDQDSLPPYDVLDAIIERYVEREQPVSVIVAETGFDAEMVARFAGLIDRNEYKRKQAAPGLKVTGRAFGFGRRVPIAQRYRSRVVEAVGE